MRNKTKALILFAIGLVPAASGCTTKRTETWVSKEYGAVLRKREDDLLRMSDRLNTLNRNFEELTAKLEQEQNIYRDREKLRKALYDNEVARTNELNRLKAENDGRAPELAAMQKTRDEQVLAMADLTAKIDANKARMPQLAQECEFLIQSGQLAVLAARQEELAQGIAQANQLAAKREEELLAANERLAKVTAALKDASTQLFTKEAAIEQMKSNLVESEQKVLPSLYRALSEKTLVIKILRDRLNTLNEIQNELNKKIAPGGTATPEPEPQAPTPPAPAVP